MAQDDNSEVLEEIITTGSRIVRTDKFDTAGHVVNVDEAQIDALAQLNIADVLRSSPLNAYGSFNERSGNSAGSNAQFELRGLGASRTLVMFDGQRVPGSPNLGAASVNINMLPMTAVRRIDILADGASAVYGSDAVAGVVNVVPHHDFEGVELSLRYGDRSRDDYGDESIGLLAGAGNDKGNVVVAFEYSHRDPVFDRDREFTAPWQIDFNGDGMIDAYNETDGISYYGRSWEIYDETTGYYELKAAADCPTTGGFTGVMGAAAFGEPTGTLCTFAYAGVSANRAELTKLNTYIYADYEVTDNIDMYARVLFAENKSFGRYAPPAAGWPDPPEDHAHNPFDIAGLLASGAISTCDGTEAGCLTSTDPDTGVVTILNNPGDPNYNLYGYYRWTNIGPRDDYTTDNQWDVSMGFKGDITDDVGFDFYYQAGEYTSRSLGKYYLSYPGLDYVLNRGLDPFSAAGAGAMRAQPTQDNLTKQNRASFSVQFNTMEMAGGEAIALVGAEWAKTEFANLYDPASENGFIGGSAGNSSAGDRDFTSAFFEYSMPVADTVEVNLAGRYDNYSDFGNAFSPSVSVNWNATDTLALRLRWGEGFRAPALSDLYGPETFSAETAYDPVTGTDRQFDTYFNVNPNLDAESSTSYSVGMNWEYVEGHTVDIAYYNVDVTDVITFPTAQSLLYADAFGVSFDPNGSRVERQGPNVSAVYSFAENGDERLVDGIDFQMHSLFDTGAGVFDANLFWSHQLTYKQNAFFKGGFQDTAGFFTQPTDRAQAGLSWSLGDHAIDLIVDYIGPFSEEDNLNEQTGALTTSSVDLDSWTTMNLAYRFDGGALGQIKIGANNVTDEDPVLDKEGKYYDSFPNFYDTLGRVYYVEYKKSWE